MAMFSIDCSKLNYDPISVSDSSTIKEAKEAIFKYTGIPIIQQRICLFEAIIEGHVPCEDDAAIMNQIQGASLSVWWCEIKPSDTPPAAPQAPETKMDAPSEAVDEESFTIITSSLEEETLSVGTWNCSSPKPVVDVNENPIGDEYDLRPDNYFKGWKNTKIYILNFYAHGNLTKEGSELQAALADLNTFEGGIFSKGLEIQSYVNGTGEWPPLMNSNNNFLNVVNCGLSLVVLLNKVQQKNTWM